MTLSPFGVGAPLGKSWIRPRTWSNCAEIFNTETVLTLHWTIEVIPRHTTRTIRQQPAVLKRQPGDVTLLQPAEVAVALQGVGAKADRQGARETAEGAGVQGGEGVVVEPHLCLKKKKQSIELSSV